MFEIFKDKTGKFLFRLKDTKGNILLISQGYTQKTNCQKGIGSIKRNSKDRDRYIAGVTGFSIKSGNGQFPASNISCKSEAEVENSIKTVMNLAPTAEIKDLTK